jgi:hypothetical protein
MNRRQFLRYSSFFGMSAVLGSQLFRPENPEAAQTTKVFLEGLRIIDAHAHPDLYLYDSYTSPCPSDDLCGRLRTWEEIEIVARTGGVVCTWPLAYKRGSAVRLTFSDWAKEIREMKERLGMDHVGLGTDGGGRLPFFIEGYRDVRDLVHLIRAMEEAGFSRNEIAAYTGGNFYRVFQTCTG